MKTKQELLWLSWSARQPNKLKVRGSSPRGSTFFLGQVQRRLLHNDKIAP